MQRSRYTHIAKQVFPYSQESTTSSLPYISLVYNPNLHTYHWWRIRAFIPIIGGESDLIGSIFDVFSSRLLRKSVNSDYFGVIIYNWWRKVRKIGYSLYKTLILLKVHMNTPNIRDFRSKTYSGAFVTGRIHRKVGIFNEIFPKNRKIRNYWYKIRFKL